MSLFLSTSLLLSASPATNAKGFGDINNNNTQQQAIENIYLKGVAKGSGNNAFNPESKLSLEELITFLGRVAGVSGSSHKNPSLDHNGRWSSVYMSWAKDNNLIGEKYSVRERLTENQANDILKRFSDYMNLDTVQIKGNNTFVTRGEIAIALNKLCDLRDQSTRREVTGGEIQGYFSANDPSVEIYKGIPYAAPPTDELRWKAPQPVKPWSGVRDTIAWSASAIQPQQAPYSPYTKEFINDDTGYSEDSLYMNVWTKNNDNRNKPVIVYIHGGAFTSGGSSVEVYDGEYIAGQDAVYVSINYRLGIFGFLALNELSEESDTGSSGNYGLMDQIQALKWVQENITQFGGDPSNVTVMGQSAGAISVNALTVSPLAKGLFSKAVAMSDLNIEMPSIEQATAFNSGVIGKKTLKELRSMAPEELLKLGTMTLPVIDGYVLEEKFSEAIKNGHANKVELMSGMVPGDALLSPLNASIKKTEDYVKTVKSTFGIDADRFLTLYPADEKTLSRTIQEINNDQLMAIQNRLAQQRAASGDKATYLYLFTHILPGPESAIFGAFHTSDVPYFLNKFSDERAAYWTESDYSVGHVASQYLLNFARTGDPNGKDLPTWKPSSGAYEYMEVSDKSRLQMMDRGKAELWTEYLARNGVQMQSITDLVK